MSVPAAVHDRKDSSDFPTQRIARVWFAGGLDADHIACEANA